MKPDRAEARGAPARIGDHELLGEIGRGGMGVVYRARAPGLEREVALKVLLGQGLSPNQQARFAREGELTAQLVHPGILRVHAAGVDGGRPYLVYELIEDATTLEQALRELPRARLLDLLEQAARALGHAHAQGVTHRDVKPENVLITSSGQAKVADFGLASGQGLDRLTRTGASMGTPHYMAPEQVTAERDQQGPPTDVWALGVILYRALTGGLPFTGEGIVALGAQITDGLRAGPRERDASISPALDAVCRRALAREPDARHPDGAAFAADLAQARAAATRGAQLRPLGLALVALALVALALAAAWARSPVLAPAASPPSSRLAADAPPPAPRDAPSPPPIAATLPPGRLLTIPAGGAPLNGVCFAGPRALLTWSGNAIRLLELTPRADAARVARTWSSGGPVGHVIPDPAGLVDFLVCAGPLVLGLTLDADVLTELHWPQRGRLWQIAARDDGAYLAIVSQRRQLHLIDRARGDRTKSWLRSSGRIEQIGFLADGTLVWLASGPAEAPGQNAVASWRPGQATDYEITRLFGQAQGFCYLPRSEQLYVAAGGMVYPFSLPPDMQLVGELEGHPAMFDHGEAVDVTRALWASPRGDRVLGLAVAVGQPPRSILRCYEPETQRLAGAELEIPNVASTGLAVSPDEALLALHGEQGLQIWSLAPILARD